RHWRWTSAPSISEVAAGSASGTAARGNARRLHHAAQVSRLADAGARLVARSARRAGVREDGQRRRHGVHLRRDAAQTHAVGLVPMALRPRGGGLGLGARIDRSDQAASAKLASHVEAQAGRADVAAARAHPSPDAGGVTRQIRWSECRYSGWKNPNAMMARPTTPRPPAMYASAIMP